MKNFVITPAEMVAHGTVTKEKMEQLLDQVCSTADRLAKAFPNARFVMDADSVLRVEATEQDAGEIDHVLQETLSVFTPFFIHVRK